MTSDPSDLVVSVRGGDLLGDLGRGPRAGLPPGARQHLPDVAEPRDGKRVKGDKWRKLINDVLSRKQCRIISQLFGCIKFIKYIITSHIFHIVPMTQDP